MSEVDETTDWYIARAHAVRALGYLGAQLAIDGDLRPDFEQPKILEVFEQGLLRTVENGEPSPLDVRHCLEHLEGQ